jgi:hypothetical protein
MSWTRREALARSLGAFASFALLPTFAVAVPNVPLRALADERGVTRINPNGDHSCALRRQNKMNSGTYSMAR